MLGAPFTKKDKDEFEDVLDKIAGRVRRYNAALYWMRRLHFHEKISLLKIKIKNAPPRNPNGDNDNGANDDPNNWKDAYFVQKIPAAQEEWKQAVDSLNNLLDGTDSSFKYIFADMVQVNDYIVSM